MGGGEDEKMQMDPLSPRLHVNDTEKGWPRAPPRNKMAFCEEINLPPQRYSSGSISSRPLDSSLVPSGSQSHVGCPQKSGFSSFCTWPGSSKRAERHHFYSSSMMNLDTKFINPETQVLKCGNYQAFSTRGASKLIAECELFHPFNFHNSGNSSIKTLGKEDTSRVPKFSQMDKALHSCGTGNKLENKKLTSPSLNFAGEHQTTCKRKEKEVRSTDLKSREHLRDWTDDNCEVSQMSEKNAETPVPLSTSKKMLADAEANQLTRNVISKYQAMYNTSNDKIRLHDPCGQSNQWYRTSLEKTSTTDGIYENLARFSRKRSYSAMEGPSCSSIYLGENYRIPNIIESVNECGRGNDSEVGDAEKRIAISDTSVVDPKSGNVSPEDVVDVVGLKLFWRLRRAIACQQRIFDVQIFELHRLIKVQRLIAESPEVLSEDTFHVSEKSIEYSPLRKLLSQNIPEATSQSIKPKVDSQKQNSSLEAAVEDAHVKLPHLKCDYEKGHVTPKSTLPYSGSSPSNSFVSDKKLGPWFLHPSSQWLIPVRLPSEGFVYKPYTGPAGCFSPNFGGCSSTGLIRMDRDFMNTYGVPTLNQRSARFEPYPLPITDPTNSTKHLPTKEIDMPGSIGRSTCEKVQGNALSLFPITSRESDHGNSTWLQRIQVIKVVPHNPKSACESAARIFRSIQEERRKHD